MLRLDHVTVILEKEISISKLLTNVSCIITLESGWTHSRSVEPMRNNPSASMDEDPDPDGIDDILDGLI